MTNFSLRPAKPGKLVSATPAALVSVTLATLVAIWILPDNVVPAGSLFLSAVVMSIGLMLPVILQVRTNLLAVLRVENILMAGIIYWLLLDMLQSAFPFEGVSREQVQMAFACVGLFAAAIWIGSSGNSWNLPNIVETVALRKIDPGVIYIAIWLSFFLGMANFLIASNFDIFLMVSSLGNSRWNSPWGRGNFGGYDAILDHMQYFGYLIPSLCVMIAIRTKLSDWRVVVGIILSLIVIAFLSQSGGRRIIGVIIGAAILTWMASRPQIKLGPIFVSGLVVGGVLAFMQEMLRYRNVGFSAIISGDVPEMQIEHLHVDDNFLRLSQLIGYYPEKIEYIHFQAIYHALMLPIPRAIWSGKPTGPGFDLPALLGFKGVSFSTSIVGELWVSFGWLAVLVGGLVMGRLCGMWNRLLLLPNASGRAMIYGLGVMALFTGLRSVQALVQMSYIVLAWIVIASIVTNLKNPDAR